MIQHWLLHILIFVVRYIDVFIFTNNFFPIRNSNKITNDAWGGFFWKSILLNEICSIWKLSISFTEMFHEILKNSSVRI